VCPAIETLAAQVEALWTSTLPEDQFGLLDLEQRFKYLDSLDPEGKQEMVFAVPDPPKDSSYYPRLQVENRTYWSRAFRKLHIEVAVRQDGLQVFHCVMYPRLTYDLPILSMDLVANDGMVSLAIIDPCPVTPNLQLPPFYEAPVRQLQARYQLENNRSIPPWGQAIFSPCCVIMRPQGGEDLGRFLKYALALTQLHVQVAKIAHPVTSSPGAQRRIEGIHAAHQRYCDKQLENDKTRRVLAAAFGEQLAEDYMRRLMFDVEPLPA
jgi:phycocyanobilin:ferredoxin oxidoreductase